MSLAIDVTQEEIDKFRKDVFGNDNHQDSIFDLEVDFQSTDAEIAKFIGVSKYRQAEAVDLSNVDYDAYSKKQEERLLADKINDQSMESEK